MHHVADRLDEWRRAQRRRDSQPPGSVAWSAAEERVSSARAAYHAEASQTAAYYTEMEFAAGNYQASRWFERGDLVEAVSR